jgi:hypothetical protein
MAVVLVVAVAAYAYVARWNAFACDGATCTHESRRLATYVLPRVHEMPRAGLASHVVLHLGGPKSDSEVVLDWRGEQLVLAAGSRDDMTAKSGELRRTLEDPSLPITSSTSPHPFGFVFLGMMTLMAIVALVNAARTRTNVK